MRKPKIGRERVAGQYRGYPPGKNWKPTLLKTKIKTTVGKNTKPTEIKEDRVAEKPNQLERGGRTQGGKIRPNADPTQNRGE